MIKLWGGSLRLSCINANKGILNAREVKTGIYRVELPKAAL